MHDLGSLRECCWFFLQLGVRVGSPALGVPQMQYKFGLNCVLDTAKVYVP